MIYWLTETQDSHLDLKRGIPPEGSLSAVELARFESLHVEKRRRDWLLGRWTAKRLLQNILSERDGRSPAMDAIRIETADDGAPYAPDYPAISLSISHSEGRALCAAAVGVTIGADLEYIAPRSPAFIQDYFTPLEQNRVGSDPTLATAVWSAKEAALKALRTGLRADTRSIECLITQGTPQQWCPLTIRTPETQLAGFWRVYEHFVFCMAVLTNEENGSWQNRWNFT